MSKRGRLSKIEQDYIRNNITKTVDELSKDLDRSASAVRKTMKSIANAIALVEEIESYTEEAAKINAVESVATVESASEPVVETPVDEPVKNNRAGMDGFVTTTAGGKSGVVVATQVSSEEGDDAPKGNAASRPDCIAPIFKK